jgi:NADH-quinone oxidoreductase subunit G
VGVGTNLTTLGKGTAVLVVGADPEEEEPIYLLRLRGIARRGGELIVANGRPTKLAQAATKPLRYRYGAEAAFVLALCATIVDEQLADKNITGARGFAELRQALRGYGPERIAEDEAARETLRAAARAFAQAENGIIVYGREALSAGPQMQAALECLALLTNRYGRTNNGLVAILPGANTRGALGLGYGQGAGAAQFLSNGQLKALLVMGSDPAGANPQARATLEALDLLVVHDLFLSETARMAHVVLPLAAIPEQEGTFTNAERRVQRFRQARTPEGMSRTGWEVARDLAQLLGEATPVSQATQAATSKKAKGGKDAQATTVAVATQPLGWDYVTVSDVAAALTRAVSGYERATYARLAATGTNGTWGRQTNEAVYYDGTSYENVEGVGMQLPSASEQSRFTATFPRLPEAAPLATDANYPSLLVAAYASYNDADPLMMGSLLLDRLQPSVAQISTGDAQRLGVASGQMVQLTTAHGAITMPALVNAGLDDGLIVAPLGMRAAPLEGLLSGALTPVRLEKVEVA